MDLRNKSSSLFLLSLSLLGLWVSFVSSQVDEDNVRCLRGIKDTLGDSQNLLSTWQFNNKTVGFICDFVGVTCWSQWENRVLGLTLREMQLSGRIPESLKYCGKSIQKLDLGSNSLTSEIPTQICSWMPFLVTIDLSGNELSGPIPPALVNCSYLSELSLSNNHLSGPFPYELGSLTRLNSFSVTNNQLKGAIPSFFNNFDREGFVGNSGLCGGPLGSQCGGMRKKKLAIIIAAGVSGAAASLLLSWIVTKALKFRRWGRESR